ncbi:MAG: phospho-sugar mutase [Candidatus Sumerlaeaceae bacterium]|nr:phospho-sugar mutase [Candidatus Sumerlaeaceae bacterium]
MLKPEIADRIKSFVEGADSETLKETLDFLLAEATHEKGEAAIEEAFYRELDFGTGGLRGLMGPGTNRMNRVVVARATQGLANYIINHAGDGAGVCIAYDSRNRSAEFAREAARVLAGNGLTAYLFEDVRPTPELSFAVSHTQSTAGIVITASHNPKEYNGYKVSWDDGGQVIPPHDEAIITEVRAVTSAAQVKHMDYKEACKEGRIVLIGEAVDEAYVSELDAVKMRPELCEKHGKDLKIVYTPLHGTGIKLVPRTLENWGFHNVVLEPSQAQPNGNFPTTKSPNPEERAAMELSLELARREKADVVFATDPDADRIGIAVLHNGDYQLMTGNQVGALLSWYVCETLREQGRLPANGALIKTIVTTELIAAIAADFKVSIENCLTGFKWIASLIRGWEERTVHGKPEKTYLFGCEESYGYLIGTHARDKDAVVTACVLAEMALWAKTNGKTLVDLLHDLFARYGVHIESQLSKTMPGKAGMETIGKLMESLRANPPASIGGVAVRRVTDIQNNTVKDIETGKDSAGPGLPKSNVLLFALADGSVVVARPSGTEPKIKFYFMVVDRDSFPLADRAALAGRIEACQAKEQKLLKDFDAITAQRVSG